jgi:hypothetical protein
MGYCLMKIPKVQNLVTLSLLLCVAEEIPENRGFPYKFVLKNCNAVKYCNIQYA